MQKGVPGIVIEKRATSSRGIGVWGALALILGLAARLPWLDYQSEDYVIFLKPWMVFLDQRGVSALGHAFSNYPPFYTYLLLLSAKAPVPWLWSIKFWSVLFDLGLAGATYLAARELKPENRHAPFLAAAAVWLLPTVVVNSSVWGQCDSIYATFVVASLWRLILNKRFSASIFWAVAFSIKPQAIFFLPVLLARLWWDRKVFIGLLCTPWIYLMLALPAWIAGRNLFDLLTIYANQNRIRALSSNAPNVYAALPAEPYQALQAAGLCAALGIVAAVIVLPRRMYREPWTPERTAGMALVSVLLVPSVLPGMHERYFYLADVLSVFYAFCFPRRAWIAVAIQSASLLSYFPFLWKAQPIPVAWLGLSNSLTLVLVLWDFFRGPPSRRHAAELVAAGRERQKSPA
jgi:Gpi18-like mannosyltransferase